MREERREVVIEKLVAGGMGLARLGDGGPAQGVAGGPAQGEVVMVPRVAVGERLVIAIDRTRRPARGRVLKMLDVASARVTPSCPVVERCGGCDWMHLDADAQRAARLALIIDALPAIAKSVAIEYHAATPARGRTRARWHAQTLKAHRDGVERMVLGYRELGSNTIVEIDACPAIDPRLEEALVDARAIVAGAHGDGDVNVALGEGGRPVLALSFRGEIAPSGYREAEARVSSGRLAGVQIELEGARVPATIGDPRPVALAADGLPLRAPAFGFAQASEVGDAVLVARVVDRAAPAGKKVVELFAGSGNLTVALARDAAHVIAVELVRAACDAARANLAARGLAAKVRVTNGDADEFVIPAGTDVVVLDPPRAGARGATARIAGSKAKRAVYVSCDPTTLGRDLATLIGAPDGCGGWQLMSLDAIDLFPDTSHVEVIATLDRLTTSKGSR